MIRLHHLPSSLLLSLSLFLLLVCLPPSLGQDKLAARHSFEPPFGRVIPYWTAGAGAFVNTTFVRLTPAKQSRTGFIWNQVSPHVPVPSHTLTITRPALTHAFFPCSCLSSP
jgi:hypothetical protein